MNKELILKNQIPEISHLEGFIEEISDELGLDMAISFNLNLALEEVVTNVISYAFPTDEEHTFTVTAEGEPGVMLTLQVVDDGFAFDPLEEAPEVDITLSAEERNIGGLGIFLVKQIMDEVNYSRTNDKNILTMRKKIG